MKRIIEAYQKIAAPKGLRERIEAQVQSETQTKGSWGTTPWFEGLRRNVLAVAVAAVCLVAVAGVVGSGLLEKEEPESAPGIRLALEEGDILGNRSVAVDMVSDKTQTMNAVTWMTENAKAVLFQVKVEEPVTFTAKSNCLSVYDEEKKQWTDCEREHVIKSESALCVLLPDLGDDEVFYVQMSSAKHSSWIEIVYDKTTGEYKAACKTKIGE